MVLCKLLATVFLAPMMWRDATPAQKGLGPQKNEKMLAHWGSRTAPWLT